MTAVTHEDEICGVFFIHNSLIIYTECFFKIVSYTLCCITATLYSVMICNYHFDDESLLTAVGNEQHYLKLNAYCIANVMCNRSRKILFFFFFERLKFHSI
jgi:hypothetical protein